jgi:Putative Actinobacterial Holin-X, holin superfamily III
VSTPAPQSSEKLLDSLHGLWDDLRGALSDRVELFSLELGSAVRAGTQILMLVVAAAVVGVTAWLAAWGVVTGVLITFGVPWAGALLIVLVVNLGAAAWALSRARSMMPKLSLPVTRRHLTLAPAASPPAPAPPPVVSVPAAAQAPAPIDNEHERAVTP